MSGSIAFLVCSRTEASLADFSNLISNQTGGYVSRIADLEQQLRDSKIVNEYLQRQTHEAMDVSHKLQLEMQDREERLKVSLECDSLAARLIIRAIRLWSDA